MSRDEKGRKILKRVKFVKWSANYDPEEVSKEICEHSENFEKKLVEQLKKLGKKQKENKLKQYKIARELEMEDIDLKIKQKPETIRAGVVVIWSVILSMLFMYTDSFRILFLILLNSIRQVIEPNYVVNVIFFTSVVLILLLFYYIIYLISYKLRIKRFNSRWASSSIEYKKLQQEINIIDEKLDDLDQVEVGKRKLKRVASRRLNRKSGYLDAKLMKNVDKKSKSKDDSNCFIHFRSFE